MVNNLFFEGRLDSMDQEKANVQIIYKLLENSINDLEKEVNLSINFNKSEKAGTIYNSTEGIILENLKENLMRT